MNSVRRHAWIELIAVLCVFLVGLGLRLYRLPEFPTGLHYDEAANGLDALDVLAGARSIFFERNYGREPLFIYLQTVAVWLLGPTAVALRSTSAIIGAVTVPAVYWMVREAFWRESRLPRWLAFWSALFLATSYWHLTLSRVGYRAIMLPLLASLAFALFWRSWRQLTEGARMPWVGLVGCGLFVGLSLYTYTAARFLPILVALVAGCDLVRARLAPSEFRRRLVALLVITVTALIVFSPLAVYFISHPESFFGRASQVSIFNADRNGGNALGSLLDGVSGTVGMFIVSGDANLRHNPAGRSILDILMSGWLLLGLAICVSRWRSLPHLFLLGWLVVFALPAIASASKVPHSLRALGMVPAVCTVPVVAMLAVSERAGERWRQWAVLLPVPFLLFASVRGIDDYFSAWQTSTAPRNAFQTSFVDLVDYMNVHSSENGAWILPVASTSAWMFSTTSNYHVKFLYRGTASYGEVAAGPAHASSLLARVTQARDRAYLVNRWSSAVQPEGIYLYADPKHLLSFLLAKYGRYVGETDVGEFSYLTYDLPVASDYRVASAYVPADLSFGGKMSLTGYAYGRTVVGLDDGAESLDERRVPSGGTAWVTLRWQAQTPIALDLKTTLRLTDSTGHLAGQVDDLLVSDGYPFSRTWETGEVAYTYHILPTLPALAPGQYNLNLGVYEAQSGQPWRVVPAVSGESQSILLGPLEVTPGSLTAEVAPGHWISPEVTVAPGLRLVGYDLVGEAFSPGDRVPLTMYWQALSDARPDYRVSLSLQGAGGHAVVEQGFQSVGGQYSTTRWRDGEIVRAWQDLTLPATLAAGEYSLVANIQESGAVVGRVALGSVAIRGRPRSFSPPTVQYPDEVTVGEGMRLVGHDLRSVQIHAGSSLGVTLHWRAERQMDRSYTVFVHLLDASGRVRAQQDSTPGVGALPTTSWAPGEYLDDPYLLPLPPDLPAGGYTLEIGAYDPATGVRLLVRDSRGEAMRDHIILPQEIHVVRP